MQTSLIIQEMSQTGEDSIFASCFIVQCENNKTDVIVYLTDQNECLQNNGGCKQSCTNTPGSFYCNCDAGFSLASDQVTCQGKRALNFQYKYIFNILI